MKKPSYALVRFIAQIRPHYHSPPSSLVGLMLRGEIINQSRDIMHHEKRVIEVFEHLAHRRIALTVGTKAAPLSIATCQLLLEPRLYNLEKQVNAVHESRGIADGCGPLRTIETITGFAVGVLAGLDLAGRVDLVSKFAVVYQEQVRKSIDPLLALAPVPAEALQPVRYAVETRKKEPWKRRAPAKKHDANYMTIDEATEFLNVSARTLWRMKASGKIPLSRPPTVAVLSFANISKGFH
jgi:hypothetical protein